MPLALCPSLVPSLLAQSTPALGVLYSFRACLLETDSLPWGMPTAHGEGRGSREQAELAGSHFSQTDSSGQGLMYNKTRLEVSPEG